MTSHPCLKSLFFLSGRNSSKLLHEPHSQGRKAEFWGLTAKKVTQISSPRIAGCRTRYTGYPVARRQRPYQLAPTMLLLKNLHLCFSILTNEMNDGVICLEECFVRKPAATGKTCEHFVQLNISQLTHRVRRQT